MDKPPGHQGVHQPQYPRPPAILGSKISVGLSNSVSHSSYNSANEELEFDLYDYEHKRMICDTSDPGDSYDGDTVHSSAVTGGHMDFSFSELAPKKLFDSRDTVINIADDILDENKQTQNTFGTPVVLRRGQYNAR